MVERVVLNALGRWLRLCRQIFASSAVDLFHRLAEKPIHLSMFLLPHPAWADFFGPTPGE
jgi:hypothetical protein